MPWAQGVGRSNRPAPTISLLFSAIFRETAHLPQVQRTAGVRTENMGLIDRAVRKNQPNWYRVSTILTTLWLIPLISDGAMTPQLLLDHATKHHAYESTLQSAARRMDIVRNRVSSRE
jgi:hypothetical protein